MKPLIFSFASLLLIVNYSCVKRCNPCKDGDNLVIDEPHNNRCVCCPDGYYLVNDADFCCPKDTYYDPQIDKCVAI